VENEGIEFHQRVRQGYLEIAKSFPERICIIKGEKRPEEIFFLIKNELSKHLK